MSQSINTFIESVSKRNPNEPEFMQAVKEVAETVIPFIEENTKYQNKMLLERMVEAERIIMFRVTWILCHRTLQRWNSFSSLCKLKHFEISCFRTNF
jgi:hypothetical protein